MHSAARVSIVVAFAFAVAACRSAPPPPPPAPQALNDSATAALNWVSSHAVPFNPADSLPSVGERMQLAALAGDARIVGFSELTEGTREFPLVIRRALFALAEAKGVRGLAIQAPMAEAMEIDRYVRSGVGDPRRLLRELGSWRWETREMLALVNAMRDWNRAHPAAPLGFYGFEIPSAALAVHVVTSLPDSVTGAPLKSWLTREYACVAMNEGAHWGLEGRAADSTFWNRCNTVAAAGVDSLVALRRRTSATSTHASDVAFAEQMARLIQHHVSVSLRHMTRHDANAEHVLFLANALGADAKLMLWGGDVEMGRLTLDRTVPQTGLSLGQRLGTRYRAIAFAFGNGSIRARRVSTGRGGQPGGLSDIAVRPPLPNTYEDVLGRVAQAGYWLDARTLPADAAGAWLKGSRPIRLITEIYTPEAPELVQTPIELPANYDAIVFVRTVSPSR